MPRFTKKIDMTIELPETWQSTWNPIDETTGKPILDKLPVYEVGPGKVKIFSLPPEELAKVQQKCMKTTIVGNKAVPMFDATLAQEEIFIARLGGSDGYWEGFEGADGQQLNCTTDNQRKFSHYEGLRIFVCQHVGPILDKIAEGKAEEEEKNSLLSLTGEPVSGNGSTRKDASGVKKR